MQFIKDYIKKKNLKLKEDTIKDKYKCGICKEVLCKTKVTKRGCNFCESCIDSYLGSEVKSCPKCNMEQIGSENDLQFNWSLDNKIESLKLKCPNICCELEVEINGMEDHLNNCGHSALGCVLEKYGCTYKCDSGEEMKEHLHVEAEKHLQVVVEQLERVSDKIEETGDDVNLKLSLNEELINKMVQENLKFREEINKKWEENQVNTARKINEGNMNVIKLLEQKMLNKIIEKEIEMNEKFEKKLEEKEKVIIKKMEMKFEEKEKEMNELREEIMKLKEEMKKQEIEKCDRERMRIEQEYGRRDGDVEVALTDMNKWVEEMRSKDEIEEEDKKRSRFVVDDYEFELVVSYVSEIDLIGCGVNLLKEQNEDLCWPIRNTLELIVADESMFKIATQRFRYDSEKPTEDTMIGCVGLSRFDITNTINIRIRSKNEGKVKFTKVSKWLERIRSKRELGISIDCSKKRREQDSNEQQNDTGDKIRSDEVVINKYKFKFVMAYGSDVDIIVCFVEILENQEDDLCWPLINKMEFKIVDENNKKLVSKIFGFDTAKEQNKKYYEKPNEDTEIDESFLYLSADDIKDTLNFVLTFN